MSEFIWTIGWPDIARADAGGMLDRLEAQLRYDGIIAGPADGSRVYEDDARAYAPGPGADEGRQPLVGYATVALRGPGYVHRNAWEGARLICASCAASTRSGSDAADDIQEAMNDPLRDWAEAEGDGRVTCPVCREVAPLNDWLRSGALGLAHVAVESWNWEREPFGKAQESLVRAIPKSRRLMGTDRL